MRKKSSPCWQEKSECILYFKCFYTREYVLLCYTTNLDILVQRNTLSGFSLKIKINYTVVLRLQNSLRPFLFFGLFPAFCLTVFLAKAKIIDETSFNVCLKLRVRIGFYQYLRVPLLIKRTSSNLWRFLNIYEGIFL